ncbi:hypothetical protein RLOC_00015059 [Lonchura striata]|uniref:Uncharacterized protein n=1 Tax=Lonchura striata TaxID=40157 RepID=A0A218UB93_9PASE|nr:hypothetical protein RLOC_00015059 [Lonchura striata domestica]
MLRAGGRAVGLGPRGGFLGVSLFSKHFSVLLAARWGTGLGQGSGSTRVPLPLVPPGHHRRGRRGRDGAWRVLPSARGVPGLGSLPGASPEL